MYTVLDSLSLQDGRRVEVWHGMWTKKATNTPERKALFQSRRDKIQPAIDDLLRTLRIFVAPLPPERRVLARIESAIMNMLWSADEPINTIPDRGMALAPRRPDEPPFIVHSYTPSILFGIPSRFEA